jgi:hypothetical protein
MANHPHMQLYSLDATALKAFHGGFKKRITDFIKGLLGLRSLSLWSKNDSVVEILDLDKAVERMVYTFLNPVRARQSKTIDSYRGFNTDAAESRISDADISQDAATATAAQIRQHVASSLLGQANLAPQIGLRLLQNA